MSNKNFICWELSFGVFGLDNQHEQKGRAKSRIYEVLGLWLELKISGWLGRPELNPQTFYEGTSEGRNLSPMNNVNICSFIMWIIAQCFYRKLKHSYFPYFHQCTWRYEKVMDQMSRTYARAVEKHFPASFLSLVVYVSILVWLGLSI